MRNYILVCLFLFFVTNTFFCQKQKKVDSLITVFEHNKNSDESTKAKLLYSITINSSMPEEKLAYANLLLKNSKKYKPNYYKVQAYNFKGVAYRLKGDLKSSFKNLFKSAKLAFENNMPIFEAEAYSEISNTYAINKDFSNSLLYQNKAISIFRKHASKNQLAIALLNTGFDHYSYKKYDDALELYNEAEPLFEEINIPI